MNEIQQVQWFPGHMAKTRRLLKETVSSCDAVVELLDARIPFSSQNPEIKSIIGEKPHIIILNKSDLADSKVTALWTAYFSKDGASVLPFDCKSQKDINAFKNTAKNLLCNKIEANRLKGMSGKKMKLMVVGIPNVGKSSFINRLSGYDRAKSENRPGVTRSTQWFSVDEFCEILDTPGVLWPKFDDKAVGERLAFTGAVVDRILDTESLALRLLEVLSENYSDLIKERYKVEVSDNYLELYEDIAKKRGFIMRGGDVDYTRTANMLLEEFRSSKIGRITLERP